MSKKNTHNNGQSKTNGRYRGKKSSDMNKPFDSRWEISRLESLCNFSIQTNVILIFALLSAGSLTEPYSLLLYIVRTTSIAVCMYGMHGKLMQMRNRSKPYSGTNEMGFNRLLH
jgi:hypothetical protein